MGVVLKTWLNWRDSHINKWDADYWRMLQFGVLLALAGTSWVLTSAAFITFAGCGAGVDADGLCTPCGAGTAGFGF